MGDVRFSFRYLRRRRLRGRAAPGLPAPFVVGVGRSGTTLLRLMLDAHPELAIPPETHFMPVFIQRSGAGQLPPRAGGSRDRRGPAPALGRLRPRRADLEARFAALEPFNTADALRAFYKLYADGQGKPRWGDKTPDYVKRMRRIKRTLPEAKFIHVIRDGRDVTLSTNRRIAERGHRKPLAAAPAARRWRERILKAQADGPYLGAYLEVRYEDLVTDTEPHLRRVCEFLELEFDPVMLRYHESAAGRLQEMAGAMPARAGRPAREAGERLKAHEMATKPPSADRIEVWRREMDPEYRQTFEIYAGQLLGRLGYETQNTAPPPGADRRSGGDSGERLNTLIPLSSLVSRVLRREPRQPPFPFVVGMNRSGTTLLRMMLDAHPAPDDPARDALRAEADQGLEGGGGDARGRARGDEVGARVGRLPVLRRGDADEAGGSCRRFARAPRSGPSTRPTPSARASRAGARRPRPTWRT